MKRIRWRNGWCRLEKNLLNKDIQADKWIYRFWYILFFWYSKVETETIHVFCTWRFHQIFWFVKFRTWRQNVVRNMEKIKYFFSYHASCISSHTVLPLIIIRVLRITAKTNQFQYTYSVVSDMFKVNKNSTPKNI